MLAQEQTTIQRILSGESSFFSQIIETHQYKIRSYISKRCTSNADTEDITQEIFIAAFRNLHLYDKSKPFSAWIFGIARNKSNEHFRKVKRVPLPTDQITEVSHANTPDIQISISEKSSQFWSEAKRLLSEEQHTAIWLKYQQELTVAEISEAMQLTTANIKIHLFRARKKLATSSTINQLAQ